MKIEAVVLVLCKRKTTFTVSQTTVCLVIENTGKLSLIEFTKRGSKIAVILREALIFPSVALSAWEIYLQRTALACF